MPGKDNSIHGDPNHYDVGSEFEEMQDNSEKLITKDNENKCIDDIEEEESVILMDVCLGQYRENLRVNQTFFLI